MPTALLRRLRGLLLAVAAGGFFATAQAAVYVGVWDPPYGQPFTDLGWRGEVRIDAPTSCGAASGFSGTTPCTPGAAYFTSAVVELYRLTGPNAGETYNTLSFTPSTMNIVQLAFVAGELVGAVSARSNWLWDATQDALFALQFAYQGMTVSPGNLSQYPGGSTYTGPVLWYKDKVCVDKYKREHGGHYDPDEEHECDRYKEVIGTNDLVNPETRPTITFSQVPEPGTLALALAGGIAALRLRRRQG